MQVTTKIHTATPTKIKATGRWGARVDAAAAEGDTVRITTKSGKQWDARVTRVWWTGDDRYGDGQVSICSTEKVDGVIRDTNTGRGFGPSANQMDQLDCGHYPDNPQAGCSGCRLGIGL